MEVRFVNRQAGSPVMGLPVNVVDDLAQREQFFQQRLVNLVPARRLEFSKGVGRDLLETFTLHLSNVDATKEQAFAADVSKQVHVHPVGGFGFAVQAGDEVEPRQQFRQASCATHAEPLSVPLLV